MIKHVTGYYKWEPSVVDGLFYDRKDYKGILFYYDYLIEIGYLKKNT